MPGAGNVISGSKGSEDLLQKGRGVEIANTKATRNTVQGNWIGTAAGGSGPLGNEGPGVFVNLAGHNSIGGVSDGAGNVIAFNGGDGVVVTNDSTGNRISRNSIYANGGLGINLVGGTEDSHGVTANDPGDADTGPNNLQNYPVLSSVMGGSYLSIHGNLNSTPNSTFRLEFFATSPAPLPGYRDGRTFLGWAPVTTDPMGNAPFALTIGTPVSVGQSITATATDQDGNTSEFSEPIVVTLVPGTEVVTNMLDSGQGSLRQAILNANAKPGRDTIAFSIPGTGVHTIMPVTALPTITDPVVIDGYTQPGSSVNTNGLKGPCNAILTIVIDGTALSSDPKYPNGLQISGGNSHICGLVINSFPGPAVFLEHRGGNVVEGNYLGTDNWGLVRHDNSGGVWIDSVSDNVIGGTTAAARNVLSGSKYYGVAIEGEAGKNIVQGNYIGVDAAGTGVLGDTTYGRGVIIDLYAPSNTIGGTASGAGNVIGGSWIGIYINGGTNSIVAGNLIGTNAAGDDPLKNSFGIIVGGGGNTIGGTVAGSRNIISGNSVEGVRIIGDSSIVQGNYIGTDITGTKALGNCRAEKGAGVRIWGRGNVLGGRTPAAGNVISGNYSIGVAIDYPDMIPLASRNRVEGNWIGTQADGSSPLGNQGAGVMVTLGAGHNTIGGAVDGAGNVIAFNGDDGVRIITEVTGNLITRNSIYANVRLGINLVGGVEDANGVTTNDPGDADTGPNNLQNYPVLSSVVGGSSLSVQGRLNSTPNSAFTLEFFATPVSGSPGPGEGQTYLGWKTVQTDASGNVSFNATIGVPVSQGRSITATATDSLGNTSEFSASVIVTATGVASKDDLPRDTELMQNYPNPFNPSTVIRYGLPNRAHVNLTVFSMLGQQVAVLQNGEEEAGYHDVSFDGRTLSSGVYLYRMQVRLLDSAIGRDSKSGAGDVVQTRKLIILK
jgi:hypothetical protein